MDPDQHIPNRPREIWKLMRSGPLLGRVRLQPAKNSVLKLLAACLLAEGTHVLDEVPGIADVGYVRDILETAGAGWAQEGRRVFVKSPAQPNPRLDIPAVSSLRASVVFLAPLLARCGTVSMPFPGGDDFGLRPIDLHLSALALMGAEFEVNGSGVKVWARQGLRGARIVLEYPSHTATDNIMMAAVLAKGTTVIVNAAREPEVSDLADFLRAMGARIEGDGTSHVSIEGTDSLVPAPSPFVPIPDRVEAATFMTACALCKGSITIENARPEHLERLIEKFDAMGVRCVAASQGLEVACEARLSAVDVPSLPYPGIATDYLPLLTVALSVAEGVSVITENVFGPNRFRFVGELAKMGADITIEGHHAVVRGVPSLRGAAVKALDVRAGAAMVLAGLAAEGQTVVEGIEHVRRGYEALAEKLVSLGASIEQVRPPSATG
jgi:UDP-N-acetylglucosamine 1-carboxyvinyltransferase